MIKKNKSFLKEYVLYPPKNGGILKLEILASLLTLPAILFGYMYDSIRYEGGVGAALSGQVYQSFAFLFLIASIIVYMINVDRYDKAFRYRDNLITLSLIIVTLVIFLLLRVFIND